VTGLPHAHRSWSAYGTLRRRQLISFTDARNI
jgi:hypothetical protein